MYLEKDHFAPPKPRYQGTVVCPNCHSEYSPDVQWYYGYYTKDTTGDFKTLGIIPKGRCPVCRAERIS